MSASPSLLILSSVMDHGWEQMGIQMLPSMSPMMKNYFFFGAEFRLDLGLYKRWGKHSLGVEVGTDIALPVIHKNDVGNAALQINDIPLYTYALTPYIALTSIPLQMISHLEQHLESNPQWDGSMRDLMTEMQPRNMPMTTSNTSSTFQ